MKSKIKTKKLNLQKATVSILNPIQSLKIIGGDGNGGNSGSRNGATSHDVPGIQTI